MTERAMIEAAQFVASLPSQATATERATSSSAIQRLVEGHSEFVWRSLRRLGVPEGLVDDATQQVFLVASRKLDRIQTGSERAFLFRTLAHVAAHARRSLARRREEALPETCEPIDTAPRPDEVAANRQSRALLDEALGALPFDLRTVFVLFELEELSAPEIAELLGLPLGTVASRLRRGREKFRQEAGHIRSRATQFRRGPS